jgi:RecA/RadA recombinase
MSQLDVDLPIHRAVIQACIEILKHQNQEVVNCIHMELLALQLNSMIKIGVIMEEEKPGLISEVDRMYSMSIHPEYFLSILPSYLSEVRIKRLIKGYKPGEAVDLARRLELTIDDTMSIGKEEEDVEVSPLITPLLSHTPVITVPSGISSIDSRMTGGLGKGELGIICGMTGLGKTTLAVNFCWGAASATYKALLITLEIPAKKISERLYSRITQIDYSRIRSGDNGDMENVNREVWGIVSQVPDRIRQNFRILDFSKDSCSIKEIGKRLSKMRAQNDLPDVVFLDWLDALETDPEDRIKGTVKRELRHELREYSNKCSELAKEYNVAFWATTQSNASGDNNRNIRMTNASEGFGKSHRCSVFLGIGATDADRETGRLTVKAGKMRDGRIFETQIQARLDKQTFEDVPPDLDFAPPEAANFTPINERGANANR